MSTIHTVCTAVSEFTTPKVGSFRPAAEFAKRALLSRATNPARSVRTILFQTAKISIAATFAQNGFSPNLSEKDSFEGG